MTLVEFALIVGFCVLFLWLFFVSMTVSYHGREITGRAWLNTAKTSLAKLRDDVNDLRRKTDKLAGVLSDNGMIPVVTSITYREIDWSANWKNYKERT